MIEARQPSSARSSRMKSKHSVLLLSLMSSAAFAGSALQPEEHQSGIPATRHQLQTLDLITKGEFARFTVEEKAENEANRPLSRSQEEVLRTDPASSRTNGK